MNTKADRKVRSLKFRFFSIFALCMLIPMLVALFTSSYFSEKYYRILPVMHC